LLQVRGSNDVDVPLLRMEPPLIGGIYPGHNEDRELVRLDQVPKQLIAALIATEDRKFYTHWGIDPRGIARALYKTVTGQHIEGGSTLTQQLVKNFFLTPERTLARKANEALMALLLEMHYSKEEILETYLNEIFLGQDANRAIHGFGLASYFYFDRPLDRLEPQEIATLVGMVKGPTVYDPRKHPELALKRRNVVLQEMVSQNVITQAQFVAAVSGFPAVCSSPVGARLS
jgi:penicillin-binding protein 1B